MFKLKQRLDPKHASLFPNQQRASRAGFVKLNKEDVSSQVLTVLVWVASSVGRQFGSWQFGSWQFDSRRFGSWCISSFPRVGPIQIWPLEFTLTHVR
jgi:hypothetical protein